MDEGGSHGGRDPTPECGDEARDRTTSADRFVGADSRSGQLARDAGEAEPLPCVHEAQKIVGRSRSHTEKRKLPQHGPRADIQNVLWLSQQMPKRTKDTDDAVPLLMPYYSVSRPNSMCLLRKRVDPDSSEVHFQDCRSSDDVKGREAELQKVPAGGATPVT